MTFWGLLLRLVVAGAVLGGSQPVRAQGSRDTAWEFIDANEARTIPSTETRTEKHRAARLNYGRLQAALLHAPAEKSRNGATPALVELPTPDGSIRWFRCTEVEVMHEDLAARFPELRTYQGTALDDPTVTARFDLTAHGFHGQILSSEEAIYIDPWSRGSTGVVAVYRRRDHRKPADDFVCQASPEISAAFVPKDQPVTDQTVTGQSLRTYRLACAATAEYTTFQGGTVSGALSAIVTAINRINGIYERELGIRMVLVPNNNLLIYTNQGSDPYSNNNGSAMLSQNQSNVDAVIGSANYDIGHVFSTGGGGVAILAGVCVGGLKAQGVTGSSSPVGDAFWVDYVAHEMGHQFGANHTFNSVTSSCGGGNRNADTAFEPGSGSTIMAYAGICGTDNLQSHSDPYFHHASAEEIITCVTSGNGSSCPVVTFTGNNPPTVAAGPDYIIPRSTPFELIASGSDSDGDPLTYCWEERDLGSAIALSSPDNGSSPLFRSFNPTASPTRTFPRLSWVLNATPSPGETLPSTSRTLNFRVTARDNRVGGGGINTDDMQVTVVGTAGPFTVTAPNSNVVWSNLQTVTWSVAGTTLAPINAASVNILLSTNGGQSFPFVLATNTPNDGSQTVVLPSIASTTARIKVQAAGSIFFDISDTNFTIRPFAPAPQLVLQGQSLVSEACPNPNGVTDPGEQVTYQFALRNIGNAPTTNLTVTLLATNGISGPSAPVPVGTLAANAPATNLTFTFSAAGACGSTVQPTLLLQGTALSQTLGTSLVLGSTITNAFQATNAAFIDIVDNDPAAIYPSSIAVAGLTGTVTKVTVSLQGFSHSYPDDVDLLLVGPGGQSVMLMSDVGGGTAADNLSITFNDSGAALPDATALTSTTYAPGNFDPSSDAFPSPAPQPPYSTLLSSLNQVDPNGTWQLFVWDDARRDSGSIARGWSLDITTVSATCSSGAAQTDLAISQVLPAQRLNPGSVIGFTLLVTNAGPATATGVFVTNTLPMGASLLSVTPSQGTWRTQGHDVVFDLGILPAGAAASLQIAAAAEMPGVFTNIARVACGENDTQTANNLTSGLISINAAPRIAAPSTVSGSENSFVLVSFSVSDEATAANDLVVTAASVDTNLLPASGLVLGGTGTNRFLAITPAPEASGTGIVTITVSDGMSLSSASVEVVVLPVNAPPVLSPIPSATVHAGSACVRTVLASDSDLPKQTLVYSLAAGTPASASINPTNGQFIFRSTDADVGSTNRFTVVVSDGIADSAATLEVVVRSRPTLHLARSNAVMLLSWDAIVGQNYRVQASDSFGTPDWVSGDPVTAHEEAVSLVETNVAAARRFYRLEVLP